MHARPLARPGPSFAPSAATATEATAWRACVGPNRDVAGPPSRPSASGIVPWSRLVRTKSRAGSAMADSGRARRPSLEALRASALGQLTTRGPLRRAIERGDDHLCEAVVVSEWAWGSFGCVRGYWEMRSILFGTGALTLAAES